MVTKLWNPYASEPLIVNIRINILKYERDRVSSFTENQKIRRLSQSIEVCSIEKLKNARIYHMNKKATATATQGHSRDGRKTTVAALPRNLKWRVATSLHKKSIIQYSKCHFLVNRVRDPFGKGSGHSHSRKQSHNHSHSSGHRRSHSHSQSRSHSNSYEKLGFPKENLCF